MTRLGREVLPDFLPLQRWFGAKGEKMKSAKVRRGPVIGKDFGLAVAEIETAETGAQTYFLPLTALWGEENLQFGAPTLSATLAKLRRTNKLGALLDASADPRFAEAVVAAMRGGADVSEGDLRLRAEGTQALADLEGVDETRPLGAEQSNVSLAFGDKGLLKIYRRLRSGRQPDIEIARFLTENTSFANTPAFFGEATLTIGDNEPATIAACFAFVSNQGDGWTVTVDALTREIQDSAIRAPAELAQEGAEIRFPYPLDIAGLIGRRTAELHNALAIPARDRAFGTEPMKRRDIAAWTSDTRALARDAFRRLAAAPRTPEIDELIRRRKEVDRLVGSFGKLEPRGFKTRIHGDYHLGQVLVARGDIFIIDFEGEPRRDLKERRARSSPLRDVAGMVRSFDYAAFAAVDRIHAMGAGPEGGEVVARQWRDLSVARFLAAYAETISGGTEAIDGDLLRLFILQKALYEIGYEAANRPAWISLPVRGVLALLDRGLV